MPVLLPEEIERQFTSEDLQLHLALGLFLDNRVTLGQAASIAKLSQSDFLHELGTRRIPIHYDELDAAADIATANQREA
jgi:predicted HTH domain antitoxin